MQLASLIEPALGDDIVLERAGIVRALCRTYEDGAAPLDDL